MCSDQSRILTASLIQKPRFLEGLMIGAALGAAIMFILILLTANKSDDEN